MARSSRAIRSTCLFFYLGALAGTAGRYKPPPLPGGGSPARLRWPPGRTSGIILHPGQKTDPDEPVEIPGQRFKGGNLGHRIGKYSRSDVLQLFFRQRGIEGQNLDGTDLLHFQPQIIPGLFPQVFPSGSFSSGLRVISNCVVISFPAWQLSKKVLWRSLISRVTGGSGREIH